MTALKKEFEKQIAANLYNFERLKTMAPKPKAYMYSLVERDLAAANIITNKRINNVYKNWMIELKLLMENIRHSAGGVVASAMKLCSQHRDWKNADPGKRIEIINAAL
eukprot:2249676-Rhodomonas_salina.1